MAAGGGLMPFLPITGVYRSLILPPGWWLGAVVSVVGRTNKVNQHRARLVLGRVTASGLANLLGV